jgi:outer membrane protein TolC
VSVRLAESNLDAEKKKYENGLSTSFQILQVEEELASARLRLVQAVTGYRRALVSYHRSIGRLLDYAGVTFAD